MSFEVTGKLVVKFDVQQVSGSFRKREFVMELSEEINGNTYTNYAKMQLVQNKCDILDRFKENDMIKVNFNIKGNRWEKDGKVNYITNLDAWRIENAMDSNMAPQQMQQGGYNNPAPNFNNNNMNHGGNNFNNNQGGGNFSNPSSNNAGGGSYNDDLPF